MENIKNVVEALIFSAGAPIAKKELIEKVPELTGSKLDQAVKELKKKYGGESGVLLLEFNGKLQFSSSPAYGDIVAEALKPLRERQLSRTLLEVLATVAYRQPVTRLELEEMRGKSDGTTTSCEYAISGLLKAGLIEVVGRKETVGRPFLYGTTDEFLKKFGLSSLEDLPDASEVLEKLKEIYQSAMAIAETANVAVPENQPYIGMNAFAHKAGMHADGVLKYSSSFEHVDPESVGNKRKLPLSEISGKSAIYDKLKNYFPSLDKNGKEMSEIVAALKERSLSGYQYEGAEASFILLVEKILGKYKSSFDLINYKVINELPAIEGKVSSAIIKIRVDGTTKISASDGEGPVHAMDLALRSALSDFYPEIRKVTLTDFKVRVLDSDKATAAKVRVLITSANGADSWTTVGVSEDIIEASWTALTDSIDYALMRR